ncbi:MAG: DUF3667 domain-containing protein [Sphingomicrobium sp.]
MTDLESLGDAVTGGVLGRAVETRTGEADGRGAEVCCLNCGAVLTGPYCHECGQQAHAHRTLSAFFHDLLHGVLHFEGKIWRTLPLLVWRPGELTRDYIEGQRARVVSPIALFLFCVFMLFAIGSLTGGLDLGKGPTIAASLDEQIANEKKAIATLETERSKAASQRHPTIEIDRKLKASRDDLGGLRSLRSKNLSVDDDTISSAIPDWLRRGITHAAKNPELIFYKLKTDAYKFGWALIPLSVPFLWLLFPFSRRFRLYDHTVFVTYSLCFMSLLAMLAMVLGRIGLDSVLSLLSLIPPVHMYRQLKGAYGLTRFGALWRASLLTIFAFIPAVLFVIIIAGVGISA